MPRPRPRRAFLSLAWGGGLLVALHASAPYWLPARLETYRDLDYVVRRDRWAARHGAAPTVAALGSSRMLHGLDGAAAAKELQAAFGQAPSLMNFGSPGGEAGRSLVYLGRLIRDRRTPDFALVEASPTFLGDGPLMETFLEETAERLSAADRAWLQQHGFPVDPARIPDRRGPTLWAYRREALAALFPWAAIGDGGALWVYHSDRFGSLLKLPHRYDAAQRAESLEAARKNFEPVLPTLRFQGPTFDALRATLDVCRGRGVRACLVVMPEGPAFRSWHPLPSRANARERLRDLAAQTGAALVDAWDWFDEEAFVDSHHLFQPAAAEFSARLARDAAAQWAKPPSQAGPPSPVAASADVAAPSESIRR